MTLSITHAFVSGKADGVDPTLIQPSYWNAALSTSMATGKILGRATAGTGAVEELAVTGSGNVVLATAPTVTGLASDTININGATLGSYKMAINGTGFFGGAVQCNSSVTADTGFYNGNTAGYTATGFGVTTNYTIQGGGSSSYWSFQSGGSGGVILNAGSTSWAALSDETTKVLTEEITDGLAKVVSCRASLGYYKSDFETKTLHPFLVAQDIQKVLPEAVTVMADDHEDMPYDKMNRNAGLLSLAYSEVIPLMFAAFKDVAKRLDAADAEIADLKAQLAALGVK